jgi:metal transporter CNNM
MRHRYSLLLLFRCALASPLFASLKSQVAQVAEFSLLAKEKKTHTHPELWSSEFWEKILMSMGLVLLGGVFAGCAALLPFVMSAVRANDGRRFRLTLGLMGLDELHLRVLAASSVEENERRNAKKGVSAVCFAPTTPHD